MRVEKKKSILDQIENLIDKSGGRENIECIKLTDQEWSQMTTELLVLMKGIRTDPQMFDPPLIRKSRPLQDRRAVFYLDVRVELEDL